MSASDSDGVWQTASSADAVTGAESVRRARDDALAAIADAATLDELKDVRLEHAADRSALARANRSIGQLPPDQRKEAGQRIGEARKTVGQALTDRGAEL